MILTNISTTAAPSGSVGGGGFTNMVYFDAPGSWTAPATIVTAALIVHARSTGGGGGRGATPGNTNGGAGGASSVNSFFSLSSSISAGGAGGLAGPSSGALGANGASDVLFSARIQKTMVSQENLSTPTTNVNPIVSPISMEQYSDNRGGIAGKMAAGIGPTGGDDGFGRGGDSIIKTSGMIINSSTVYPITIGQAGAGGGGGGYPGTVGGAGGGPTGGAGGSSTPGGNGGLVPHAPNNFFFKGSLGSIGGNGGLSPGGFFSGAGGGSGDHGFLIIHYND